MFGVGRGGGGARFGRSGRGGGDEHVVVMKSRIVVDGMESNHETYLGRHPGRRWDRQRRRG